MLRWWGGGLGTPIRYYVNVYYYFFVMDKIYHDESDPQLDAVERYYKLDMSGGVRREDSQSDKDYHLYFLRSQIISDVESQLSIVTRGRKGRDGVKDNELDSVDKYYGQFNRWIDTYIGNVKKPLAKYIVEDEVSGVTNIIDRGDEIDLKLRVGDWWNDNVLKMLNTKIHDYVVNGVMYRYLSLYFGGNDDYVVSLKKDLELFERDVKNLMLSYKAGSVKKSFHPFP